MTEVKIKTISDRVYYTTTNIAYDNYIELFSKYPTAFIYVKDEFDNEVWVKTDAIEAITLIEESEDD
ncbi:TPA: hypothetical protein RIB22_002237 [Staphylococcus aureus]|nr:hypothetical protein [Staphylococcus aureus]HDV4524500.1 hypothetical protein [Staphylococcus aureus]HDV4525264.1 hypothetical protein [Staphylococcus aureus]